MNIAYLMFAYSNPLLLSKVVHRLTCESSTCVIHIDQKSSFDSFAHIGDDNILFTPIRIPVYWAEYSGIEAILTLLQFAFSLQGSFDYYILLSGSDYPIRSNEYIRSFLARHLGTEFINMVRLPNNEAGKPMSRINTIRFQSKYPIRRFFIKLLSKCGLAERDYRKYLGTLQPFAGNTWWALTREACQYILDFVQNNPSICKYFEKTFAPEEMFFHTILGNSIFGSRVRRNLIYEDWSLRGAHPALITHKHVLSFEAQDKTFVSDVYGAGEVLFARKFSDDNLELVERIDQMIARKDQQSSPMEVI